MHEYNCFIISPIGDPDSEVRKAADDLLEFIVMPALKSCGFLKTNIMRADMLYTSGSINSDILMLIKTSDLCIIDVTGMNPNVMYECGMRHGNGKPYIMMVKSGESLPFDIAGIRTIHYDLSSVRKVKDSQNTLEQFITAIVESGFVREDGVDTLGSIAENIRQVEQKIDVLVRNLSQINIQQISKPSNNLEDILQQLSPQQAFKYALVNQDIKLVENLLPRLEQIMQKDDFIVYAIIKSCAMGSSIAAGYVKENWDYISATLSFSVQCNCIGAYITYCNKMNIEEENLDFINSCLEKMLAIHHTDDAKGHIFNQWNRIYYGAYMTSGRKNRSYLDIALEKSNLSIKYCPDDASYYFNKATLMQEISIENTIQIIEKCLSLDEEDDADHLALAYELFVKTNHPDASEILKRLEKANPYLAYIKKAELK